MLILYCASNYPYAKYDRSNSSYKCERVAMGRTPWNIKDIITPYLLLGQLLSILEVLYPTYNCAAAAITSHFKAILWLFIEPVYVQSFGK